MTIKPPNYDNTISANAIRLCIATYDQFSNPATWTLPNGFLLLSEFNASAGSIFGAQERFGFVARETATDDLYVAFRGTHSLMDWITDLHADLTAHPWGKVHAGFLRTYSDCSPMMLKTIEGETGVHSVIATGHSLGGALATLAAADAKNHGVNPQLY